MKNNRRTGGWWNREETEIGTETETETKTETDTETG